MSSSKKYADLDLERGMGLRPEDIAAMAQSARPRALSPAEYLAFLQQFEVSSEELRRKPGPRGEPFTLFP